MHFDLTEILGGQGATSRAIPVHDLAERAGQSLRDVRVVSDDDVFYVLAIHLVQGMDWKEKKSTYYQIYYQLCMLLQAVILQASWESRKQLLKQRMYSGFHKEPLSDDMIAAAEKFWLVAFLIQVQWKHLMNFDITNITRSLSNSSLLPHQTPSTCT